MRKLVTAVALAFVLATPFLFIAAVYLGSWRFAAIGLISVFAAGFVNGFAGSIIEKSEPKKSVGDLLEEELKLF